MSPSLRRAFHAELAAARDPVDPAAAWRALERAHILSQAHVWPHIVVHWRMLTFALRLRDWREVAGQLPRLALAGPASALGWAPRGNTGGADVGILEPMPIPDDLARVMAADMPRHRRMGK